MRVAFRPWSCNTCHVRGACELLVQEALNGQPFDGSVLVVTQAVVVCWKQVPRQGVVCYAYSQLLVHTEKHPDPETDISVLTFTCVRIVHINM